MDSADPTEAAEAVMAYLDRHANLWPLTAAQVSYGLEREGRGVIAPDTVARIVAEAVPVDEPRPIAFGLTTAPPPLKASPDFDAFIKSIWRQLQAPTIHRQRGQGRFVTILCETKGVAHFATARTWDRFSVLARFIALPEARGGRGSSIREMAIGEARMIHQKELPMTVLVLDALDVETGRGSLAGIVDAIADECARLGTDVRFIRIGVSEKQAKAAGAVITTEADADGRRRTLIEPDSLPPLALASLIVNATARRFDLAALDRVNKEAERVEDVIANTVSLFIGATHVREPESAVVWGEPMGTA